MMVKFNQNYLGYRQHEAYMVGLGHMLGLGQAELLIARGIVKIEQPDKPKRKRRKRAPSSTKLRSNDDGHEPNSG